MDISFKGIRDASALKITYKINETPIQCKRVVLGLDNLGEKTLDKFQSVLKEYEYKNKNVLLLDILTSDPHKNSTSNNTTFLINCNRVDINNENLSKIAKIQKLLKSGSKAGRKINQTPGYTLTEEYADNIANGLFTQSGEKMFKEKFSSAALNNIDHVKKSMKEMSSDLSNLLTELF